MAEIIKMPRLSDTMKEGVVSKWHKKEGDKIKEGDLLADIETDKATMEFESFQEGVLLYIGVKESDSAPVDSILAILGEKGEDISNLLNQDSSKNVQEETDLKKKKSKKNIIDSTNDLKNNDVDMISNENQQRLKISPLAKKIARERGIDINKIQGSGDSGRIIKRDLQDEKSSSSNNFSKTPLKTPLSQMRKTIAQRLSESKFSAPHFYLTAEINVDNLIQLRENINKSSNIKISYNDIIIKAVAFSLTKHPNVNVSWGKDSIILNKDINIGVAISVEDGLVVPVIRNTDQNNILEISEKIKNFVQKANDKKLSFEELSGNTFTVSNLGMFGIDEFTAIINPPDACILAVGSIKKMPIVKNEELGIGYIMKITLSSDHRIVDGAEGAKFLNTLKTMLENPLLMI